MNPEQIALCKRLADKYASLNADEFSGLGAVIEAKDALHAAIDALGAASEADERLRVALAWYADEARALARHVGRNKDGVASSALLASITVLSLDGGARADAAMAQAPGVEPAPKGEAPT